jgi:hypothetical protein
MTVDLRIYMYKWLDFCDLRVVDIAQVIEQSCVGLEAAMIFPTIFVVAAEAIPFVPMRVEITIACDPDVNHMRLSQVSAKLFGRLQQLWATVIIKFKFA